MACNRKSLNDVLEGTGDRRRSHFNDQQLALFSEKAAKYGVDERLLLAIGIEEAPPPGKYPNGTNPDFLNANRTAHGIMQLTGPKGEIPPSVQDVNNRYHLNEPLEKIAKDDATNIEYAAAYVSILKERCENDIKSGKEKEPLYKCVARRYNGSGEYARAYSHRVYQRFENLSNYFGGENVDFTPAEQICTERTAPEGTELSTAEDITTQCVDYDPVEERKYFEGVNPPNPHHATVFFNIGGTFDQETGVFRGGYNLTPPRPEYVQHFEYTSVIDGGVDSFYIRLFDPNWDFVEQRMLDTLSELVTRSNDNPIGPFSNCLVAWGYTSNLVEAGVVNPNPPTVLFSRPRLMTLINYRPRFVGTGVEIELEGLGQDFTLWLKDERKVHNPPEGNNGVTSLSETVKEAAALCGIDQCCVQDTKELRNSAGELLPLTQSNESIAQFINRNKQYAEPKTGDGKMTYLFHYSPDTATLHFHSVLLNRKASRRYVYGRHPNSLVLDFTPNTQSGLGAFFGFPGTVDVGGSDSVTGNRADSFGGVGDEPLNVQPSGGPGTDRIIEIYRQYKSLSSDASKVEREAAAREFFASLFAIRADMTIIGDPFLKPGMKIEVIVMGEPFSKSDPRSGSAPGVTFHFTSGCWIIERIRHVINSGSYLSTLHMFRTEQVFSNFSLDKQLKHEIPMCDRV